MNNLLLISIFFCNLLVCQSFLIISNKKMNISNLTINELRDIFRGDQRIINGKIIELIYLNDKSHDEFYSAIFGHKMTSTTLAKYWLKRSFQGYRRPRIYKTSNELLEFVNNNSNTVAFIDLETYESFGNKFLNISTVKINNKMSTDREYYLSFKD